MHIVVHVIKLSLQLHSARNVCMQCFQEELNWTTAGFMIK